MENNEANVQTKEGFVKRTIGKIKDTASKVGAVALGFLAKNPMLIVPVVSILGGVVTTALGGGKTAEKCLIEDEITGADFRTKHPLTNQEILELGSRMSEGQSKGDALSDMGLLKNERRRK